MDYAGVADSEGLIESSSSPRGIFSPRRAEEQPKKFEKKVETETMVQIVKTRAIALSGIFCSFPLCGKRRGKENDLCLSLGQLCDCLPHAVVAYSKLLERLAVSILLRGGDERGV